MSTPPAIRIKRHYVRLSEKETDALVGAVADMVVTFIKNRGAALPHKSPRQESEPATETGR